MYVHFSVGLSGRGCEAVDASGIAEAVATPPLATVALLRKLHKMCPVLCAEVTSFWPDLCPCDLSTSAKSKSLMDMDAICNAFCTQSMVLKGCLCEAAAPSSSHYRHSKHPMIRGPNGGSEGSGDGGGGQVETTTEPDWVQLCASLCQVGEGGVLCNCDKPPFI